MTILVLGAINGSVGPHHGDTVECLVSIVKHGNEFHMDALKRFPFQIRWAIS